MKQNRRSRPLPELALALLTFAALMIGQYLVGVHLMPHRYDYGAVWESYLQEERDSLDVLCFGSSICYCDVVPAELYARTGLTSFVMAGPEQTPEILYYYVREACRTQRPSCVLAEITGCFFGEQGGFTQINVGYMPFSVNRIGAGMAGGEGMLRLALFPICDFHSELTAPQLPESKLTAHDGHMLCGYTLLTKAEAAHPAREREGLHLPGTDEYERHACALEKLAGFCSEEGIRLICYFAPATEYPPLAARKTLSARLLDAGCDQVWDLAEAAPDIGIDDQTDWYDFLHFNRSGAEKFTAYLADRLAQLGVMPNAPADAALWQQRVEYWRQTAE